MSSLESSLVEMDTLHKCHSTPITNRTSSVIFNLSSVYNNYKVHLDILKLTGVIVLFSVMTATLTVTNNLSKTNRILNNSDCVRIMTNEVDTVEWNTTLCSYFKQYPLPDYFYATICSYQVEIRIDLSKRQPMELS